MPNRIQTSLLLLLALAALPTVSIEMATLPPCPDRPNCVSSLAEGPEHAIAPLEFTGKPTMALQRLQAVIERLPRSRTTYKDERHLSAEVKSAVFRFVDELDFLIDPENKLIHVRSAARSGYYDFGVNRRRIERIRTSFNEK